MNNDNLTTEEKASLILFGDSGWFRNFSDNGMEDMLMPDGELINFRDLVNRIEKENAQ